MSPVPCSDPVLLRQDLLSVQGFLPQSSWHSWARPTGNHESLSTSILLWKGRYSHSLHQWVSSHFLLNTLMQFNFIFYLVTYDSFLVKEDIIWWFWVQLKIGGMLTKDLKSFWVCCKDSHWNDFCCLMLWGTPFPIKVRRPEFDSWLCLWLKTWTSHFTSKGLSFLLYKVGKITPTLPIICLWDFKEIIDL